MVDKGFALVRAWGRGGHATLQFIFAAFSDCNCSGHDLQSINHRLQETILGVRIIGPMVPIVGLSEHISDNTNFSEFAAGKS